MFGDALVTGIVIMLSALTVVAVVAVLLFRRRSSSGRGDANAVPPPVDPGPAKPERARDVNAEDQAG
jgi:hypothetical protein